MKKNKIIKVVTYDNFPFGGAAANFLRYFSLSISEQSTDIEVILPTGNFGPKIEQNTKRVGVIGKLKYRFLGFLNHPVSKFGKIIDNFFGLVLPLFYFSKQRFSYKTDYVILYDNGFFRSIIFIFLKYLFGFKLIMIIPEYYEKPNKLLSLSSLKWYSFYFSINYISVLFDAHIVVSYFLRDLLTKDLKSNKPTFILPNLMDYKIFKSSKKIPYKNDKITIGYAGTPTRKDGIYDLILSFHQLNKLNPQTHLLIIGDSFGGESVLPDLKRKSKG